MASIFIEVVPVSFIEQFGKAFEGTQWASKIVGYGLDEGLKFGVGFL
jgi:hypothetical protein